MALKDVTLKRYNGSSNDTLYPTTHLGQIYTDNTEGTLLDTYLDNTFINQDQLGAANGVATLDGNAKLLESQLPTYLFGGMEFEGNVALENGKTVDDLMAVDVQDPQAGELISVGQYLIVSSTGILSQGSNWTGTILPPGDEGDYTFPVELEAGDWIVVNAIDLDAEAQTPAPTVTFAIVNNTYSYATTSQRGIVRLSDATNAGQYDAGTNANGLQNVNDVLTEGFLQTNMAEGELNGGTEGANDVLNKVASSNHIHDGRYYTETEVAAFFGGSTSITGYNKSNWDTAYDDKINSVTFNTGDGVITFTQQDNTTLTVDLDGRFAEDITAAQTNSTDGIDVVQSGNTYTVAHHDTSSVADLTGTNGNVLQSMTFDTFGHVLTRTTTDLDTRYYTETEINDWLTGADSLGPDDDFYTPIEYGANPTSTVTGAILIFED